MDDAMGPLDTITTGDLIAELRRRHEAFLMMWIERNGRASINFYGSVIEKYFLGMMAARIADRAAEEIADQITMGEPDADEDEE